MGPFGLMMPSPPTSSTPEMEDNLRRRQEQAERVRARLREQLVMGVLDDRRVEIEVEESAVALDPPIRNVADRAADPAERLASLLASRRPAELGGSREVSP